MMRFKFARPLAWLLLAFIIFVTVSPIGERPNTVTMVDVDRAVAYLLLGFAFALAYPKQWKMVAMQGYTGNMCSECQNFTMVRNGTCEKCDTCGATSGCS